MTVNTVPKVVIKTKLGTAFLGDSIEVMKRRKPGSVNLIMTSPPFALTRKKD